MSTFTDRHASKIRGVLACFDWTGLTGTLPDLWQLLAPRGDHPGLVHIFSAMEPCPSVKPWHDKGSGKTFLRSTEVKCLHYYFYFIDRKLGLCYLRVPTWAPFRLQSYCNGHSVLARELAKRKIAYTLMDGRRSGSTTRSTGGSSGAPCRTPRGP
jgi:hypothetical protein